MRTHAIMQPRRRLPLGSSALFLLLGMALPGCGNNRDSSESDEGLAAEAFPECEPGNEDLLRRTIASSVSRIRLGLAHADLKLMDEHERKLGALRQACEEAFERVCDAHCTVQRGSVYLFRASALQLLASKPSSALTTAEDKMLEQANLGLEIVRAAADRLPRQQGFDAADAPDKTPEGGFNAYIKAFASLRALRAELQMAAGDVWYRRASVAQSKALNFYVSDLLGGSRGSASREDVERSEAFKYYEEAYWTLLDARATLPTAELAGSPLFAAEQSKVYALTEQVGERLRSVREGKLYIGIDPSGLQSSGGPGPNSITDLSAMLGSQYRELREVEGELEGKIKEWGDTTTAVVQHEAALAETLNSRRIDLEIHKIGEIHESADALRRGVEDDIRKANTEKETLELQAQIASLKVQFEVSKQEFQNDLARIELQEAEDMLQFEEDGTRVELDKVRGAIDATMAEFNFAMQLEALDLQRRDTQQSRDQQTLEAQALANQIVQVDADIKRQRAEIARLEDAIRSIDVTQNQVLQEQIAGFQFQLEAIGADVTFYTQNDRFVTQICQARKTLAETRREDLEELAKCLKGGSCPSGSSVADAYKQITEKKKARRPEVVASLEQVKRTIQQRLNEANNVMSQWNAQVGNAMLAARAASTAAAIAAAIPDGETGIMGPFPVKTLRIFEAIADGLTVTADLLQFEAEYAAQKLQMSEMVGSERAQLAAELIRLQDAINQANFEAELANLEEKQALAELDARFLEAMAGVEEREKELIVQQYECDQTGAENERALARARAERKSVETQIRAQTGERAVLDLERAQQKNLITQAQIGIERDNARLSELAVRQQQVASALAHLDATLVALARQRGEIVLFQGKVQELETRKQQLEKQLDAHIEQAIEARTTASAAQKSFVREAIKNAEKMSLQQIEALQQQIAANQRLSELGEQLKVIEKSARDQLVEHKKNLEELRKAAPISNVANVIWDFEDFSAQLMRGAGELLAYKRELLANVNYFYNAYRYRYNLLGEFVGAGPIIEDEPYIWTAADARTKMSRCAFLGEAPTCVPSSLATDTKAVNITHSTFIIDRQSPMFQELLRGHKTQFEFARFGRNKVESRNLGNFVLWDEETMDDSEMRVLGFYLSFPQLDCHLSMMEIGHAGLGYQVMSGGRVNLEMRPPVRGRPAIFSNANNASPDDAVKARIGDLSGESKSIGQLVRELEGVQGQGLMPFLGYPLRGTFELTTADPQACLNKVIDMRLTVAFAKRR